MNNITKLKVGDTVLVKCKVEAVFINSQMVMVTTRDCDQGFDAYADELEDCSNTDCLNCVLDKIRAEIKEERDTWDKWDDADYYYSYNKCLEIIDKYKAEGSDKE